MADFEFLQMDGEPLSLESAVFQALGAASMCWVPLPNGVFDSDRAKDIGDKLVAWLGANQRNAFGGYDASPADDL